MNTFCEHHKNSIKFAYRCFDRILLNGLIQPFQQPERVIGFFNAYREGLRVTRHLLADLAQQFQNWLKNRCQKWSVPIVEAPEGRRDDFVAPYFKHAKNDAVVVILKAREPARIMMAIGAHPLRSFPSLSIKIVCNIEMLYAIIVPLVLDPVFVEENSASMP